MPDRTSVGADTPSVIGLRRHYFCLGGSQEMTMHLVVDFGRLSWPLLVTLDISDNRVGWFVPTLYERDRRAV